MEIRPVAPGEHEELGDIIVSAYAAIDPFGLGDYEHELRDVAGRATGAEVLVAVDPQGVLLGGVTYVPGPGVPAAEFSDPEAAGIRMLAVAPAAQRRGVGESLVRACIERARATGRRQIILHTGDWMTTAHRLYERLGFEREPSLDVDLEDEGFWLRCFRLEL